MARKEQAIYQVNLRVKKKDYEHLKFDAEKDRKTIQHYIISRLVEFDVIGDENENEGSNKNART